MPLQPGDRVADRYRVGPEAGRGAVGIVHAATDEVDGGPVALKVPAGPVQVQRVLREGRALLAMGPHPDIVTTRAVVQHRGDPVLVQDWAGDGSLADRLAAAGPAGLGLAASAAVGAAVARALAHAHRHGLVHRDVKPSNVLFSGPRARLTDFSLFGELIDDAQVTRAGMVVGSLAYMSPEQFAGVPQSAASDVFGLGVLLFECLYGRTPFAAGGTLVDQLSARLHGTVEIPPSPLATLLGRCLAADPALRPPAHEVAAVLTGPLFPGPDALQGPYGVTTAPGAPPPVPGGHPPSPRRRGLVPAVTALGVTVLAVAAAAAGLLPWAVPVAAVLVLGTLGAVWAFRRLARPASGADDVGLLARMEQGEDLTRSMLVQVDEVVAQLAAPEAKFLGLSVMATIRDYDRAEDFGRRAELLQQAVATMQQLVRELSPWYVRHKEAITLLIAVVGAGTAVATAVVGFLRP